MFALCLALDRILYVYDINLQFRVGISTCSIFILISSVCHVPGCSQNCLECLDSPSSVLFNDHSDEIEKGPTFPKAELSNLWMFRFQMCFKLFELWNVTSSVNRCVQNFWFLLLFLPVSGCHFHIHADFWPNTSQMIWVQKFDGQLMVDDNRCLMRKFYHFTSIHSRDQSIRFGKVTNKTGNSCWLFVVKSQSCARAKIWHWYEIMETNL